MIDFLLPLPLPSAFAFCLCLLLLTLLCTASKPGCQNKLCCMNNLLSIAEAVAAAQIAFPHGTLCLSMRHSLPFHGTPSAFLGSTLCLSLGQRGVYSLPVLRQRVTHIRQGQFVPFHMGVSAFP